MNDIIYFKLNECGIGDIIISSWVMDRTTSKTKEWLIDIENNIHYRTHPTYRNFIQSFLEFLYPERNPKLLLDSISGLEISPDLVPHIISMQDVYKTFSGVFDNYQCYHSRFKTIVTENYGECVVLNTRNRLNHNNNNVIEKTIDILNQSQRPVVIVGEKQNESGYEGNNWYLIYKKSLDNLIDKTFDKSTDRIGDINEFLYDYGIVANSLTSISFGCGGFFCCATSMNKCISYHNFLTPKINFCPDVSTNVCWSDECFLQKIFSVVL